MTSGVARERAARSMTQILIVEDEKDLLKGLEINLSQEGYQVLSAMTGEAGLNLAISENPDLIILDVMLPGISGLDFCRELRQKGIETPIIILTAKGEEVDRVVGLEIGADDYLTKPFSLRELLARIRARLRRQPAHTSKAPSPYRFGDIEVDFEKFRLTRGGQSVELTSKEYELLGLLVRRRGEVLTRDRILNEIWGYQVYPTTRTVDMHILKLRQKLEDDPANPRYIITVYGEGYRFVG